MFRSGQGNSWQVSEWLLENGGSWNLWNGCHVAYWLVIWMCWSLRAVSLPVCACHVYNGTLHRAVRRLGGRASSEWRAGISSKTFCGNNSCYFIILIDASRDLTVYTVIPSFQHHSTLPLNNVVLCCCAVVGLWSWILLCVDFHRWPYCLPC